MPNHSTPFQSKIIKLAIMLILLFSSQIHAETIHFWNGNKSSERQEYELEILQAALTATQPVNQAFNIYNDLTNYPKAEDEGNVFQTDTDILVTVAGNKKFTNKDKLIINTPITKGLLGHRILIIKQEDQIEFDAILSSNMLKNKIIGIPATWADADLFRFNQYQVQEKGDFDTAFSRLKNQEFDYFALGANEINSAFQAMAKPVGGLKIESSIMLYYPFPLIFYVNPEQPELAKRIAEGLDKINGNGQLDEIFNRYYGDKLAQLNLNKRRVFVLQNPILPNEFKDYKPDITQF